MNTKLTDFTSEELTVVIIEMTEAWEGSIYNHTKAVQVYGPDHDRTKYFEKRTEILQNFLVQLRTANVMVVNQEKVNQN